MSFFGPGPNRAASQAVPTPAQGEQVAEYTTYADAQRAVDYLSDQEFPVQFVTIVGTGLQLVERVTGRLTWTRVALAGAASGMWFGLFVGLLLSVFSGEGRSIFQSILPAVVMGAGFGTLFSLLSYAMTRGRRDFTSTSQVVASRYAVLCQQEHSGRAREVLLTGQDANKVPASTPGARVSGPWVPPEAPVSAPVGQASKPQTAVTSVSSSVAGQDLSGGVAGAEPGAESTGVVSGPTYGEMVDKARRERAERERAERERAQQ